jgi:alkylhydroperoxidase/carboxymuconolactone decarboxylase family protein YurZ
MNAPYPPFIQDLQRTDPALHELVARKHDLVMGPGALDARTNLLILLAVDAFAGSSGVRGISAAARQQGASDAQLAEAIRIAFHVAGNKVLVSGAAAFGPGAAP